MVNQLHENHEWMAKHGEELDKYPGKWVAIDQARLIAVADTLKELAAKPEVKAAKHPAFHLVLTEEEANSILIL